METEKITINLGMVELGKIDLLVEQGIFSNRSDFIRTAIRTQLAGYETDIKEYIKPAFPENSKTSGRKSIYNIGVIRLSKNELLGLREMKQKASIVTVGVLYVESSVTKELFLETVESIRVYGAIVAGNEIKKLILEMGDTK